MIPFRLLLLSAAACTCVACDGSKPGSALQEGESEPAYLTAETLGEQVVLPTADYLELPRYRDANLEYGNSLVSQCRTCHGFERGAAGLGPSLFGVFGRKAGSVDGYPYSPALADASFYWTPRALDAWLARPGRFLPGNSMAYAGLPNREDRDALIGSLLRLTEPPLAAERE